MYITVTNQLHFVALNIYININAKRHRNTITCLALQVGTPTILPSKCRAKFRVQN